MNRVGLLVAFSMVSSCSSYRFVANGAISPKPPQCGFKVLTTVPADMEEIGILQHGARVTSDLGDFRELVSEQVCAAGGDAVVLQQNFQAQIVSATVFAKRAERNQPQ